MLTRDDETQSNLVVPFVQVMDVIIREREQHNIIMDRPGRMVTVVKAFEPTINISSFEARVRAYHQEQLKQFNRKSWSDLRHIYTQLKTESDTFKPQFTNYCPQLQILELLEIISV